MLWGGKFWTSGYHPDTVGQYGNEKVIREYVEKQGRTYRQIHGGAIGSDIRQGRYLTTTR